MVLSGDVFLFSFCFFVVVVVVVLHSAGCLVVPHYGFNFHSPNEKWNWVPFHIFISYLDILSCKVKVEVLAAQSFPTLCNPMDCSPPSSSVHGILQARMMEWVAIFFCRGSSWSWNLGLLRCRQILYWLKHQVYSNLLYIFKILLLSFS